MIKFDDGFKATGIYDEGYNVDQVNVILISSVVVVVVSIGSVVLFTVASTIKQIILSDPGPKQTGLELEKSTKKQKKLVI